MLKASTVIELAWPASPQLMQMWLNSFFQCSKFFKELIVLIGLFMSQIYIFVYQPLLFLGMLLIIGYWLLGSENYWLFVSK